MGSISRALCQLRKARLGKVEGVSEVALTPTQAACPHARDSGVGGRSPLQACARRRRPHSTRCGEESGSRPSAWLPASKTAAGGARTRTRSPAREPSHVRSQGFTGSWGPGVRVLTLPLARTTPQSTLGGLWEDSQRARTCDLGTHKSQDQGLLSWRTCISPTCGTPGPTPWQRQARRPAWLWPLGEGRAVPPAPTLGAATGPGLQPAVFTLASLVERPARGT